MHPLNVQAKLVKYLEQNKIVPIGYCPIARGSDNAKCPDVTEHEIVKGCSEKYGKTGAQILLNWGLQRGHIVIPKTSNEQRLVENFESQNFKLDPADVEALSSLDQGHRICDGYVWLEGNGIFA